MLQRLWLEFKIRLLSKSFDVGLWLQPDMILLKCWTLDRQLDSRLDWIQCWLLVGYGYFAEFRVHLWSKVSWNFECRFSHAWIELFVEYCIRHWLGRLNLTCSTLVLILLTLFAPYADIESDRAWDKATYLMIPRKLLLCFLLLALKLGRCSHVCNHDYDALAPQLTSHKACCFADWKKRLAH